MLQTFSLLSELYCQKINTFFVFNVSGASYCKDIFPWCILEIFLFERDTFKINHVFSTLAPCTSEFFSLIYSCPQYGYLIPALVENEM